MMLKIKRKKLSLPLLSNREIIELIKKNNDKEISELIDKEISELSYEDFILLCDHRYGISMIAKKMEIKPFEILDIKVGFKSREEIKMMLAKFELKMKRAKVLNKDKESYYYGCYYLLIYINTCNISHIHMNRFIYYHFWIKDVAPLVLEIKGEKPIWFKEINPHD